MAGGNDFLRVFVAQLVERERAQGRDAQRLGQQFGRTQPRQPQARAQVALAVREQRVAGVEHRGLQAQRGQHILHRPPRPHMHVHVARGHQRQAAGGAERLQFRELGRVVRPGVQFDGDPATSGKTFGQPAPIGDRRRRLGHPQHQAVGQGAVW